MLLVIEVGDTTAAADRAVKIPLYAEAGIREVWLVDLTAGRVEAYRMPRAGAYRDRFTLERGASLAPESFPDLALRAEELLG